MPVSEKTPKGWSQQIGAPEQLDLIHQQPRESIIQEHSFAPSLIIALQIHPNNKLQSHHNPLHPHTNKIIDRYNSPMGQQREYKQQEDGIRVISKHYYQFFIFKSMRVLLFFLLLGLALSIIYPKMSNYGQNIIVVGDTLISTEGLFKATLQQTGCSFKVESFTTDRYNQVGVYSPSGSISSCSSLTIMGNSAILYTDTNQVFLSPGQVSCNVSNFLIDDNGVFRLSCLPANRLNNGTQETVRIFQRNQTYLQAAGSGIVNTTSVLSQKVNLKGWAFKAEGGTFKMYNTQNVNQTVQYKYTGFAIFPTNLYDATWKEPPRWASFPDLRFQPRCGYLNYFSFVSPYVFSIDPHWPIFTVKDHTGYPILRLTYPMINCVKDFGLLVTQQYNCVNWVCPAELFELNGECVATCPQPYLHFIKRNESRCVLHCQTGSTINNITRVCTCGPNFPATCPPSSSAYASGCICMNGLFYDGRDCLNSCPQGFFGQNGICLSCPFMCATCTLSTQTPKFSYLSCVRCENGYRMQDDRCVRDCNPLKGQTLTENNVCQTCTDTKCVSCPLNPSTCTKCAPFYGLANNACVLGCPSGTVLSYLEFNSFSCLAVNNTPVFNQCSNFTSVSFNQTAFVVCTSCPIGTFIFGAECVTNCPSGQNLQSDSLYGICRCPTGWIMINVTCYQISHCPIKMAYAANLGMCFSCPYGCLTCIANSIPTICTSCTPGFVFFAYSFPFCGFQSPYYQCINDYEMVGNYSCLPVNPSSEYLLCRSNVAGCKVCVYNNQYVCQACYSNMYMYNNTCIQTCPGGTFPSQGQCLVANPFAPNCLDNTIIKSWSSYSEINDSIVSTSSGYQFYIFNGYLPDNNPVGSIFSSSLGQDTTNRYTYVRDAGYYCPKCIDGYASDFYGRCIPCPPPCATCVIADVNWCITCIGGKQLVQGRSCNDINVSTTCYSGQYRRQDGYCVDFCSNFYWPTPATGGINCTSGCSKGYFPTYNPFSTKTTRIWCNSSLSGWSGVPGINGPTSFNNYDYLNFLQFESAIYRKHDGRTLAFMIPFNQFLDYRSIRFPTYYIYGNTSLSMTSPQGAQYYYDAVSGRYVLNTSSLANGALSSGTYFNWYNITNQSYLLINTTGRPDHFLVTLNDGSFPTLVSNIYTYPANLFQGMSYGHSRPQTVWKKWAAVGAVFSIILLLLHVIYLGNDIMYKVDNTLILAQTVFLGEFVWAVMPIQMAQFFWGWFFAHLGFIPNIFRNTIPTLYTQNAPLPYRLVTEDANIIRNAGFAFTCLVFFLGVYTLTALVTLMIRSFFNKTQVWWPYILKNSLLSFLEILIMIVFYWSITQLRYGSRLPTSDPSFKNLSFGIAILFIVVISLYSIGRFFFSLLGGLYCFKRILIAMAFAFTQDGAYWIAFLYGIEVAFFILRIIIEKPFLMRQYIIMAIQQILILTVYSVLFFARTNFAALVIITTIIICLFTLFLLYDLFKVYTDSRNEWDYYDDIFEKNSQVVLASERVA